MSSRLLLSSLAVLGLAIGGAIAQAQPAQRSERPFLGIRSGPAAPGQPAGVQVLDVAPRSPAADAGLKSGDEITKIDATPVKGFNELMDNVAKHKPGDKVKLDVKREGKEQEITVTLGRRPGPRPVPTERAPAFLGLEARELTPPEKDRLGTSADSGALVIDVLPGSPAATAGIKTDDVITKVDGKAIASPMDLQEAVRDAGAGKQLNITIVRGKESREVKATPQAGLSAFPPPVPVEPRNPTSGSLERRVEELERRVRELENKVDKLSK
jgi:serine protease Do